MRLSFWKAAEQAKASPALVAKDPSTSTNKKEEEDLAKGEKRQWQQRINLHLSPEKL